MARGTTVRFALTILSAVLLALQLFAPTASVASAHSTHVTAAGSPEPVASKRTDGADEVVTCGDLEHSAGPTGPLRTRDRHRTAADSVPEPPALVLLAHDEPAARPPAARPAALRVSRSSTAHSPAALQVFRH
ncbi:hypothetical protein ACFOZ0_15715 [Streptomyces yaanensis]|uniref:Secreted protein n=1 Tax=Streptomyces yaanensis TaxID=1142239 RepID=A0ABV7SDV7_9ACTN|nr:hypothetical protein [Streptomyces sp. CGMCC 4.7035]WNB98484.1 hypothetical protein Q2K21_10585 [Streptomyces sp. CGMCC 4.7035]